jgi:hypothetical protein
MLSDTSLGSLKTTFGPNRANAKVILYVVPVFVLVGLVFIGRLWVGSMTMWLIAAGLVWGYFAQMRAKVDVYEKGLIANDWLGRKSSFRWDEVTEVYEFIGYDMRRAGLGWRPTQWVYTVHTRDGRRVKLDMAYEKVRNLGYVVQKETGQLLLPVLQAALRSGATVAFGGQIGISGHSLVSGTETLAWADVEKMRFTQTADLSVHKKGQHIPWKLVMHSRIANFPVFQMLLHEAVRGTPAEAAFEDPSERSQPQGAQAVANIGTVSSEIGYDIRDLLREGYTLQEIQRVRSGEITLEGLRRAGPKSKK